MAKQNKYITSCEPGVTENFPKYSGDRDYMIGRGSHKGYVDREAFNNRQWSEKDVATTGLTVRQPL